MKKVAAVCCAAVMLCGTLTFTACGGRDPIVTGDYTRPTEEQLKEALGAIDEEKLFGGAADQNGAFGFSLGGDLRIAIAAQERTAAFDGSVSYDYNREQRTAAGAGKLAFSAQGYPAPTKAPALAVQEPTDPTETDGDIRFEAALYNDSEAAYAYVTLAQGETQTEMGGKLSFGALAAAAESAEQPYGSLLPLEADARSIAEVVGALTEAGMDAWMDTSEGFKLKLVANDGFYDTLSSYAESYGLQLTYTQKTFEIYLHIGKDGILEQVSSLVDIQSEVGGGENEEAGTLTIGGNFVFRRSSPRVTLPDELSDSVKYPLYDDLILSGDPEEPWEPAPQPEPEIVLKPQTTADGVVTAQEYAVPEGGTLHYDAATDRVAVVAQDGYKIYDAASRSLLYSDTRLQGIVCADSYNGKLCLGTGEGKGIYIVDMKNGTAFYAAVVSPVYSIAVTDSCIVFGTSDQWGAVMRVGFTGEGEARLLGSVHSPDFLVAHGENIVYVIENSTPTSSVYKVDLAENTSEIFGIDGVKDADADMRLDGETLHYGGACYDADTMEPVSSSEISELYPETKGYSPAETLLITEKYSYLRGTDGAMLVYDRSAEAFRYRAEFTPDTLYERSDGTIFAVCKAAGYAAVIDPSDFPKRAVAPDDPALPDRPVYEDGVPSLPQSTKDGILTVHTFYATEDSLAAYDAATDSYIVAERNTYRVYDMQTGELRFSEDLLLDIACLDAYNGKLCLGLGTAKKIRVVNLESGRSENIAAAVAVSDIAVMNSCIVYADGDQWCSVYRVGFTGERETLLLSSVYYPVLTPNRSEGLVYAAETGLSDCSLYYIKLSDGTATKVTRFGEFPYSEGGAHYDGENVYFGGARFDAVTGERLSENIAEDYLPAFGTLPEESVLLTDEYAFLRTQTGILAVYNRAEGELLYRTGVTSAAVYRRTDGTFALLSETNGFVIVFDPAALLQALQ